MRNKKFKRCLLLFLAMTVLCAPFLTSSPIFANEAVNNEKKVDMQALSTLNMAHFEFGAATNEMSIPNHMAISDRKSVV